MKQLYFDCSSAQPIKNIKVNGGGEYSIRILSELLKKIDRTEYKIVLGLDGNKGENENITKLSVENENIIIYVFDSVCSLNDYLSTQYFDLIYFPILYPIYAKLKLMDDKRILGGVHDMSTYQYACLGYQPHKYVKQDHLNWIRYTRDFIIRRIQMHISLRRHRALFHISPNTEIYTVSNYTKNLLEKTISDIYVDKVFYSPLKLQELKEESFEEHIKEYGIEKNKYFLLSSISRWTKNNLRAIKVLDGLITSKQVPEDFGVVLLGCNIEYEQYIMKNVKNKKKFICKGYVSELELELLYKYAYSYIYPSLVEGFGYPPIEAMQYGTLSICSTSTSIPEVCGNASIYFEPKDMESIKQAILVSLDKEKYNLYTTRISKRYEELTERQISDLNLLIEYIIELLKNK